MCGNFISVQEPGEERLEGNGKEDGLAEARFLVFELIPETNFNAETQRRGERRF